MHTIVTILTFVKLFTACSIVNKLLAHVIRKYLSFNFIQIKTASQHFQNLGWMS